MNRHAKIRRRSSVRRHRRREVQPQRHAFRRPLHIRGVMARALPRHALIRFADLVANETKRRRVGAQFTDPLRAQKRIVALPLETADVEALAVDLHDGFRLHSAQQRLAADQVIQRHRCSVWIDSNHPAQQPVVQLHLASVLTFYHAGFEGRGIDEPVIEWSGGDDFKRGQ